MDMYGRANPSGTGSQSGNPSEWGRGDSETGLEESMMQLGLGSGEFCPERPGVPDCVYYMRTGVCGFGSRCRYNHPRDRAAVAAAVMATGDYPERPGEPACQYFLRTGTCKFGASCKFHHPKHGGGSLGQVALNIYGYPVRPGEKECSYYLKTGHCKFGITCKFHHPQPAGTSLPASAPHFYPSVQPSSVPIPEQYGGGSTSLKMGRHPLLHTSYVPGSYGPMLYPPGMVAVQGWPPYSGSGSPLPSLSAQHEVGATSLYGVPNLSSSTRAVGGSNPSLPSGAGPSSSSQMEQGFPERPGEPECQYYMKTGSCKFGLSCRFHHPRDQAVPNTNCVLSAVGLPLRPGVQPCTFYMQNGYCKFGSTCKFDHPMVRRIPSGNTSSSSIPPQAGYVPISSPLISSRSTR